MTGGFAGPGCFGSRSRFGSLVAGARLTVSSIAEPISSPRPIELPACAGCGQCCHLLVELVAGDEDVPEELVVEHSGVRCLDQHGDGACVALDPTTRLCTIYDRRPQVCRQFDRGVALCHAILQKRGLI